MPLKYLAGYPLAVRIAGSIHGALFLLFLVALYRAARGSCTLAAARRLAHRLRVVPPAISSTFRLLRVAARRAIGSLKTVRASVR